MVGSFQYNVNLFINQILKIHRYRKRIFPCKYLVSFLIYLFTSERQLNIIWNQRPKSVYKLTYLLLFVKEIWNCFFLNWCFIIFQGITLNICSKLLNIVNRMLNKKLLLLIVQYDIFVTNQLNFQNKNV